MKKDLEIIIPCRLSAKRLPNKPLKKINNKEMILHVYENAIKASVGNVSVATPDKQIHEFLINKGISLDKLNYQINRYAINIFISNHAVPNFK